MKEKFKRNAILFFQQIIPVIAGILIALFIENWNSERKDTAYIKQAFSTINSELNDSKEDIIATIPRQKSLIDSLDFYADNKDVKVLEIVMKVKGIYVPSIKLNGWKAVSNTKIDLVDYNKIITLSNIEDLKSTLKYKTEYLMTFLYANINETDKNVKFTTKLILLDIIQTEETLQKTIELFDKK